jgi:hypothetical protein
MTADVADDLVRMSRLRPPLPQLSLGPSAWKGSGAAGARSLLSDKHRPLETKDAAAVAAEWNACWAAFDSTPVQFLDLHSLTAWVARTVPQVPGPPNCYVIGQNLQGLPLVVGVCLSAAFLDSRPGLRPDDCDFAVPSGLQHQHGTHRAHLVYSTRAGLDVVNEHAQLLAMAAHHSIDIDELTKRVRTYNAQRVNRLGMLFAALTGSLDVRAQFRSDDLIMALQADEPTGLGLWVRCQRATGQYLLTEYKTEEFKADIDAATAKIRSCLQSLPVCAIRSRQADGLFTVPLDRSASNDKRSMGALYLQMDMNANKDMWSRLLSGCRLIGVARDGAKRARLPSANNPKRARCLPASPPAPVAPQELDLQAHG